jgi:hypothetical protein
LKKSHEFSDIVVWLDYPPYIEPEPGAEMLSYTEWLRWRDEKIRLLERSTGESKWKKLKGINDDVTRKISWKSNTARDSLWMAYEGAQWSYFVRTLFS